MRGVGGDLGIVQRFCSAANFRRSRPAFALCRRAGEAKLDAQTNVNALDWVVEGLLLKTGGLQFYDRGAF